MEHQLKGFEVGNATVTFFHRGVVWEFARPTVDVWDGYEKKKNVVVKIKSKTNEVEGDEINAKAWFWDLTIRGIYSKEMVPILGTAENIGGQDWKEKVEFIHRKETAALFGEVFADIDKEEINFGAFEKTVHLQALHHGIITEPTPEGNRIIHVQDFLPLAHIFRAPTGEDDREHRRASQGKVITIRGQREQSKVVRNDLSAYRKLYKKLILRVSGYADSGQSLDAAAPEVFVPLIDSIHQMVAIDSLFREEGAEEIKN